MWRCASHIQQRPVCRPSSVAVGDGEQPPSGFQLIADIRLDQGASELRAASRADLVAALRGNLHGFRQAQCSRRDAGPHPDHQRDFDVSVHAQGAAMRNLWIQTDYPYATWEADLTAIAEHPAT